jgi:ribose/xylose/arabinose/galactoside ABC-type transport system permease subunit
MSSEPTSPPPAGASLLRLFQRNEMGLLAAIVVAVAITGVVDSQHNYFRDPWVSAVDVLRQTALLGIFTLGAAIVIISGGIDLSSGSVIAFSGTVCATIMLFLAPDEMALKVKRYRVDAAVIADLQSRKAPTPPAVLAHLEPLRDSVFDDEETFRAALHQHLSEDDLDYEDDIVGAAIFNKPLGVRVIALAIAGTLLTGFLIGSLHAWLITVVQLPPFVATLASLVGLRSLARAIIEKVGGEGQKSTQIQIFDEQFRYLATSVWIPVLLFLILAAAMWLLMSRTVAGRHLHALGGNEQAARLSGIRTERLKWLAYVLSAMLSSIAGILYIGAESAATPHQQGQGYELNAIAAAVVGGCSLRGGVGTIPGAVLGALFLRVVIDGVAKVIKTGADVYQGLIVGVVVVAAVAFTQLRQASRQGKQVFPGGLGIVSVFNLALFAGIVTWLMSKPTSGLTYGMGVGIASLIALGAIKILEQQRDRRRKAG